MASFILLADCDDGKGRESRCVSTRSKAVEEKLLMR
jgi:hypothetical protein